MTMTRMIRAHAAAVVAILTTSGCSLLLDADEAQCWCGEEWQSQISGATATNLVGQDWSIPASQTTHTTCVTMLEHLALDAANEQDPLYQALRASLESAAVANCELAGAEKWGPLLASTDCSTTGTAPVSTNVAYVGSCWETEDHAKGEFCPLFPQCEPYYDCSSDPIWDGGGGETGGETPWECDQRTQDYETRDM